jgi:hypothetical protein
MQRQVDFLESHPDHALCFHPVQVVFDEKTHQNYTHPASTNAADFTLDELLNQNYIQTNSVMYRRQDYSKLPTGIVPGDWYLHLMHAKVGKIGFLPDVMSVYRRHSGGEWWGAVDKQGDFWAKYAAGHLKLFRAMYALFEDQTHDSAITQALGRAVDMFIELESTHPKILQTLITDFPDLLRKYLASRANAVKAHAQAIAEREQRIADLYSVVADYREHINKLEAELAEFHNSLPHKLRRKALHMVRHTMKRGRYSKDS